MKKTLKQAIFSRMMASSTILILGGGTVAPVLVSGQVAFAATSTNPVADETSARSITITKYQATELNDHNSEGDGTLNTTVTNAKLQGVKFQLQRVKAVNSGSQLTDPTVQVEGKDYTIDSSFTAVTLTTDANGHAKFNLGNDTKNDGIYIVTEVDDSGAKDPATGKPVKVTTPANPFFVYVPQTSRGNQSGLIYDVQAQPKNVIENALNPGKTINGKPGDSVVAGDSFEWELTTGIPSGLYTIAKDDTTVPVVNKNGNQLYNADHSKASVVIKAGSPLYLPAGSYFDKDGKSVQSVAVSNFNMHDTLNKDLNYKGATVWVHSAAGWVQLAKADYTVENKNGEFNMNLTAQGIKEIGSDSITDVTGKNVTGPFDQISTHIETTVLAGWNGYIPNTFDVTYQTPGGKPDTQVPPTEPGYYNGGFDIRKQDASTQADLAGAEFKIATSEANAKAGIFLASDGKSYSSSDALPSGVSYLSSTSDSKGHAAFDGLPLTWTDGGNGVVDVDPTTGLPINGDKIQDDYWVVETKAPNGYELLKTPQKVQVTLGTASDNTVELTVDNKKSTKLPFTGGAGQFFFITVALSSIAVGTAIIVARKKRQSNEG